MHFSQQSPLGQLMNQFPQAGSLQWIGVRPERKAPLLALPEVEAIAGQGLAGDHYKGKSTSTRQVTLIQWEHLAVVASFLHRDAVDPAQVRRNLVVKGVNLMALKDHSFYIGDVLLEMTGPCHPCSRMEEILGPGGYNAMRGHGGITARILQGGVIRLGDALRVIPTAANTFGLGKGL